ncbi:hypothetical protein MLD38_015952 [Melastoma candidum]|uniref:Uncharacterized protein n=1 Tax=Melastoma candidum TaxID=119954 RepID=A0ACB9RHW6_9MYRT|nr:hypothetical protein MLD38_015952 [Melastoma candidum]
MRHARYLLLELVLAFAWRKEVDRSFQGSLPATKNTDPYLEGPLCRLWRLRQPTGQFFELLSELFVVHSTESGFSLRQSH